jgi:uncharacterized protein
VGKKVKVVFDTNVWVSIFMADILYGKFLQVRQKLTVYASRDIILELSKVLLYPRIAKILEKNNLSAKDVVHLILLNCEMVEPKVQLHVIGEDEQDNKILECALAANANFIVSGDKHLLNLGKLGKTKIVSPREFFDSLA